MAWYRAGGGGIPSSLKTDMNDVLNKKFGTSQDYPPTDWAPTVNLMGPLPEKTASGAIVTFSDGADTVPLKKCEVSLPASLDGYSSVDVKHTGKNLANVSADTQDGLYHASVSYPENGVSVSATGTYSRCAWIIPTIVGVQYTLSYKGVRDNDYGRVMLNDTATAGGAMAYGTQVLTATETAYTKTFTATSNILYLIIYNTDTGTTGSTTVTDIQLEAGSTASTFEPYSGTTHTANLGRTIYGGEVDVVNGAGHSTRIKKTVRWGDLGNVTQLADVTRKEIVLSASEEPKYITASASTDLLNDKNLPYDMTYSGNFEHIYIANSARIWVYLANGTDANTEITVSYTLTVALQTDFTFDPVPIDSKLGNNTIWSEQGSAEVTYRADINLSLGGQ